MKNLVLPLAIGALALCAMVGAHADGQQVQKPWTVMIGADWPGQHNAQVLENSTAWNAGADYAFCKSNSENPALGSVYADIDGGSKSSNTYLYSYGAGVAGRIYATKPAGNTGNAVSPYAGAGVGIYDTDGDYKGTSKNNCSIGGKVFAGLEFPGSYFVQVGYNWLPSVAGVNPDDIAVDVGLRF